jgi:hypothetical protein
MILALGGLLALGPALAEPAPDTAKVLIGTVYCFMIRRPDGALTPRDRADQVQDVFAKHLGGGPGVFTIQKPTKGAPYRSRILLNGDTVIAVTDDDARATRFRTASELAPIWKEALELAFEQTGVRHQAPGLAQ